MKLYLRVFSIILFCNLSTLSAQNIDAKQQKEVADELSNFKKEWVKKLPYESKFGVIQLSSVLNLDYLGLENVKKAVAEKKWDVAEQELLFYYKNKFKNKIPSQKKLSELELQASESALNHFFRGNKNAHPLIYRGGNIDWELPAFHNGKEIKDKEWQFQYLRFLWWEALAKSYQLHNDNKYFDEWQYEMVDFAEDILPITKQTPRHIKRGMETYNRCKRLRNVFPYFIQSENFDSKTLLYFLSSFYLQAEHIRTVYSEKGNHLLGELINVFENGMDFPEFNKSEDWKQDAITKIPERMFIEMFSDGMNREFVFNYHSMYMDIFSSALVSFKKYGYDKNLPKEYKERLQKMTDIYLYQMFPDNTISQFGDAKKQRDAAKIYSKVVSRFNPELPHLEFIASKGKKGTPPLKTSVAFPESGFYFFRSEWSKNAVFMAMKNNPDYAWHSQYDNGNFELYAYGRNFMNDSGAYIYDSGDIEEQNWRKWFKSTHAHQTLTLDNKNTDHKTNHIFWKTSKDFSCLVFENQSYNDLKHRRTTLFVDNKYFLIYDEAIGAAAGKVNVHFQLIPCKKTINTSDFSVSTGFEVGSNLIVKSFPLETSMKMEKEEGWISYDILKKSERPAWSYAVEKRKEQSEVEFLTALVPFQENSKPTKIEASVKKQGAELHFDLRINEEEFKVVIDSEKKKAKMMKNN